MSTSSYDIDLLKSALDDLSSSGIDIQEELLKCLEAEMQAEIDQKIINGLMHFSQTTCGDYDLGIDTDKHHIETRRVYFDNRSDEEKEICDIILG
jgi:hypothetical protein